VEEALLVVEVLLEILRAEAWASVAQVAAFNGF
jgi:hypothetical protein